MHGYRQPFRIAPVHHRRASAPGHRREHRRSRASATGAVRRVLHGVYLRADVDLTHPGASAGSRTGDAVQHRRRLRPDGRVGARRRRLRGTPSSTSSHRWRPTSCVATTPRIVPSVRGGTRICCPYDWVVIGGVGSRRRCAPRWISAASWRAVRPLPRMDAFMREHRLHVADARRSGSRGTSGVAVSSSSANWSRSSTVARSRPASPGPASRSIDHGLPTPEPPVLDRHRRRPDVPPRSGLPARAGRRRVRRRGVPHLGRRPARRDRERRDWLRDARLDGHRGDQGRPSTDAALSQWIGELRLAASSIAGPGDASHRDRVTTQMPTTRRSGPQLDVGRNSRVSGRGGPGARRP